MDFLPMGVRYDMTYFWLFVKLFCAKVTSVT